MTTMKPASDSHVAACLPPEFADLQRYVSSGWALDTQQERNDKRVASTMRELQDYYDTMLARIKEIATYLDRYPIDALPRDCVPLLRLGQMLMEIAPAVEVMHSPDIPASYARDRLKIHPQTEQFRVA